MTIDCTKINVQKGSKDELVKEVQKYLKYYGYYTGNVDGECGNYTVEAIKKFQKANGLVTDGVFGKLSCQKSNLNGKDISSSNKELKLEVWKDIMKRYDSYVSTYKKEPNICYIDKEHPYEYITNTKYKDIKSRYEDWVKTNGKEPNIVYITKSNNQSSSSSTNTSANTNTNTNTNYTVFTVSHLCERSGGDCLGQSNSTRCGPHSIKQCLRRFGITGYSEATIAGYAGTTSAGTGHGGLETAIATIARKEGITLKVEWKNFSDLGNSQKERFKKYGDLMTDPNKTVFHHELYRNKYGHYSILKKVNTNTSNLTVANSLGSKCGTYAYCGYMESRSFGTQQSYLNGISQKSICIITKV